LLQLGTTTERITWNEFRTATRGKYTIKNYGSIETAKRAMSIDYRIINKR